MGGYLSKKQKEISSELEKVPVKMTQTTMTHQLAMQNIMREKQLAMQIGINRERFSYYNIFYCSLSPLLILGSIKSKKPQLLVPLIPLSCAYGFQYDMAYGVPWEEKSLLERAKDNAENIISGSDKYIGVEVLRAPLGMPNFDEIHEKAKKFW